MVASFIAVVVLGAPTPTVPNSAEKDAKRGAAASQPTTKTPVPDLAMALRALVAGKESALADLEKILERRPKDLRILYAIGTAHKLAGRSEAAVRTFRTAADLARKEDGIHAARPWWGLVRLYRDAGLEKEAAAAVKSFIGVARNLTGLEAVVKRIEDDLKNEPARAATPAPAPAPSTTPNPR